jgi:hypothetical protein
MRLTKAPDLSAALARGVNAAASLNTATDSLTETLGQVERALVELHLGVGASVTLRSEVIDLSDENRPPVFAETLLRFGKTGKRWTLTLVETLDGMPEDEHETPLVNASREDRILAVTKLPELVEALVLRAEERLAEVNAQREKAQEVLAALVSARTKKTGSP